MIFGVARREGFSREELIALVSAQAKLIEELRAEVAELKRQVGRNSQNSSAVTTVVGAVFGTHRSGQGPSSTSTEIGCRAIAASEYRSRSTSPRSTLTITE